MAYQLNAVTIRTNQEGLHCINELWEDISSGKLPLLFDSNHVFQEGISPVSKYSNYSSEESGEYDVTVMAVKADFFQKMEEKVKKGLYKKYEVSQENGDLVSCTKKAWEEVWSDSSVQRAFTEDYESTVPGEYTKDGNVHCYLYIAVK